MSTKLRELELAINLASIEKAKFLIEMLEKTDYKGLEKRQINRIIKKTKLALEK
jgi:hypothetical protein